MIEGMISVIVPIYNAEKYLTKTIQSVLDQGYTNFEIVAVNDGATDRSLELLKKIDDSRIRIINKVNSGVSDTRNVGIENAKGEYVCFLDADDYLARQYILPGGKVLKYLHFLKLRAAFYHLFTTFDRQG